jgi:transcriptional regulator with XRE-family HTH domain
LTSRHTFGSRLRTQRERRGVTLESIVDSTKIKLSLLEALERGDASQWPRGLFRRAYIRDYACAIGLPAEPLVAEFVKLFPDDGSFVSEDVSAAAQEPMRLTFAVEPDTRARHFAAQAAAAVAEVAAVAVVGGIASFAMGWPLLTACGGAAFVYYPLATAITGRALSPAHWRSILKTPASSVAAVATATAAVELADEPTPLYLVPRAATPAALAIDLSADEFPQPRTAAR